MIIKKYKYIFLALILILSVVSIKSLRTEGQATAGRVNSIGQNNDDRDELLRLSEAFGHFIGRNLKNPGIHFDLEKIIKGIRDGAQGKPAPIPDEEYEQLMASYQGKAYVELSEQNLKASEAFMANNTTKSDVIEIETGKLQYQILEKGSGPIVKEHDTPMINFTGKFLDGNVFGSSEQAGGPVSVPLDQTIPGFSKGIAGMAEGEKRRLFVHPELGYGTSGHLPPNTMLIFDIEVIKANSPDQKDKDDSE